jgi:hypothetical protein
MTAAWWWGIAACLPAALAAQPVPHVVQPGETLWGISQRHFGRPLLWPSIQQRNGVGEPRQLQIGKVLHFADGVTQAVVVAVSGDVHAEYDSGSAAAQPAMQLPEGALVRTGPDSFVTLRLPDGSLCTLPSNSTIRLVRFVAASGSAGVLLDLQAGEVESRVPPRVVPSGRDAFRVRTRIATVGVRGTHFRVSLDYERRLAVSVLESRVVVQTATQPDLSLSAPQGVVINDGPQGGVVQELLPAPAWTDTGLPQNQPAVLLAWAQVNGAAGYHAQLARDAEFLDVVAERHVTRSGPNELALFDGLASGSYFARVAAVTPEGIKGQVTVNGFSRGNTSGSLSGRMRWIAASNEIEFDWNPIAGGLHGLEIAEDAAFTRVVLKADGLQARTVRVQALPPGQYYWRVHAEVIAQGQRSEVFGPVQPLLLEGAR